MDTLIGVVPDGWGQSRLDEICEILAGSPISQTEAISRSSTDVPVVTPRDLRHNRIADECSAYVTDKAAGELHRYRLQPADIVCSRTGQLGKQALVTAGQVGWLIGSGCLRLRVNETVSASYLLHYLGHPAVHDWIVRNAGGAVVPSLSTKMLGALPVVIAPPAVQQNVAEVLTALDEKIIVHEQISRTTAALRDAVLPALLTGAAEPGRRMSSPATADPTT